MRVVFGLIADSAEISDGGKMNIHGVFSSIKANQFPATHPKICLILRFEVLSVEFGIEKDLRIALVGPSGKEAAALEGKFCVRLDDPSKPIPLMVEHDQIIQWNDIVFPEPGGYAFHILVQGDPKGSVPLTLLPMEG